MALKIVPAYLCKLVQRCLTHRKQRESITYPRNPIHTLQPWYSFALSKTVIRVVSPFAIFACQPLLLLHDRFNFDSSLIARTTHPLKNPFTWSCFMELVEICNQLSNGPSVMLFSDVAPIALRNDLVIIFFVNCNRNGAHSIFLRNLPHSKNN